MFKVFFLLLVLIFCQSCELFDIKDYGSMSKSGYMKPKPQAYSAQQTAMDVFLRTLSSEYLRYSRIFATAGDAQTSKMFSSKARSALSGLNVPVVKYPDSSIPVDKRGIAATMFQDVYGTKGNFQIFSSTPDEVAKLQVAYDCAMVELSKDVTNNPSCINVTYDLLETFKKIQIISTPPQKPELATPKAVGKDSIRITKRQSFTLYFNPSKYELTEAAAFVMDNVIDFISNFEDYSVTILGLPAKPSDKQTNIQITKSRVNNVKKILMLKGIPAEKIKIDFLGDEYSQSDTSQNDVEELYNRRVVVEASGTSSKKI